MNADRRTRVRAKPRESPIASRTVEDKPVGVGVGVGVETGEDVVRGKELVEEGIAVEVVENVGEEAVRVENVEVDFVVLAISFLARLNV